MKQSLIKISPINNRIDLDSLHHTRKNHSANKATHKGRNANEQFAHFRNTILNLLKVISLRKTVPVLSQKANTYIFKIAQTSF